MAMEEWIEEFLFRGRPPSGPGAEEAPAFHVVLGRQADSPLDPAEKVRRTIGPMAAGEADAMGWPLSRLVAGINETALLRVAELEADLAAAEEAAAQAASDLATAAAGLEAAVTRVAVLEVENSQMRVLLADGDAQ